MKIEVFSTRVHNQCGHFVCIFLKMLVPIRILRQALTILPASLCEFSIGVGTGWTAPTLKHLKDSNDEFSLNTEECSWLAALPEFFRAVGSVIVFLTIDIIGRKKLYYISTFFYVVSWLLILFTRSVQIMYLARTIFGVMVGLNDTTSPIYLAENSSTQIRGIFGSLSVSFYFMGILISFLLSTYLSYSMTALVIVIIQIFILSSTVLLKEPAQFLIMKGRYQEAEDVFYWLQASKSEQTKLQFDEMAKNVRRTKETASLRQVLAKKANYKSVAIVSVLGLVLTFSGAGAIISFVTIAFSQSASATVSAENLTILFGLIQLISIWISSFIIERFGRKTILITGLLVSTLTHFATATLYYWQQNVSPIPYFSWLIFATITIFAVVCGMSLYPVFFLTHGELFPQSVKGLGSCLAVTTYSLASFVTSFIFLQLAEAYGIHSNFILFSSMSVVTIVFVYICLPEARGKSLAEIEELLEK